MAELGEHGTSTAGALLVVADGMGGSVGGAQASRTVVQTLRDQLSVGLHHQAGAQLAEAVRIANRTVHAIPMQQPELRGMGSTCTAMVLLGEQAFIAHVGDSRAYLVRDRRILQLTHDHTKVHLLLQSGMITPEEAAVHPERSVLVRSIGPKADVEVEQLPPLRLQGGDRVLLCSDGLVNHVADPEILALVEDRAEDEAVESLVNLALERGGSDNTTVLMMVVGPPRRPASAPSGPPPTIHEPVRDAQAVPRAPAAPPAMGRGRNLLLLSGVVALALVLAVVGAAALWWGAAELESPPAVQGLDETGSTDDTPPARLAEEAKAKEVFPEHQKAATTKRTDSRALAQHAAQAARTVRPAAATNPATDADGDGFSVEQGDCDDADPNVYPAAIEQWYDNVDQNCDELDDFDADADGHKSSDHGGDDCNDGDRDVHPGAEEVWYDKVDQDCDDRNDFDADGDGLTREEECDDADPRSLRPKVEEKNCDGARVLSCEQTESPEDCEFDLSGLGACSDKSYERPTGPLEWLYGRPKKVGRNDYKPISLTDIELEDVYIICNCSRQTCDLHPDYHK